MKNSVPNWHVFLTIRHINGVKRFQRANKFTPELRAIDASIRSAICAGGLIPIEDALSITATGFRTKYPPITK